MTLHPPRLIGLLALCAGLAHAGTVEVGFAPVDRYTDAGPLHDVAEVQQALAAHLQSLGDRLPAGQTLRITITEIDLAGEVDVFHPRWHGVRVMGRRIDWPRIDLRYSLHEGDRLLSEGSEQVADSGYLMRRLSLPGSTRLPYEQRMLSDWFDRRFGRAPAH